MQRRGPLSTAARLRALAVGLLTATLAMTAHTMSGGAVPAGAAAVLLCVLAVTLGAVTATVDRTADGRILFALLAVGQLIAHVLLSVAGHAPCAASGGPLAIPMLAAHTAAVGVGSALIAAGGRLCRAATSAMRALAIELPAILATAAAPAVNPGDQPLRSTLLLDASVSRRGPPVSLAR